MAAVSGEVRLKGRIEKYGFIEGEDFTVHKIMNQWNHVDRIDYHLTIHDGNADITTMSSREIAELTGKQHQHVRRDIRAMLEALGKDASSFGRIYKDAAGREKEEYTLDRELTLTLVSGYDIPLRHRVVIRLAELEAKPAIDPMQVLSDPAAMRGLLLAYTDLSVLPKSAYKSLT